MRPSLLLIDDDPAVLQAGGFFEADQEPPRRPIPVPLDTTS
jgi:hypothetical protein